MKKYYLQYDLTENLYNLKISLANPDFELPAEKIIDIPQDWWNKVKWISFAVVVLILLVLSCICER